MAWNSEYLRRRHAERKAWATELLGAACVDCGATENLEFDHEDATTKVACISDVLGRWSIERLMSELAKCVLRCHPCHVVKTKSDVTWITTRPVKQHKHGTHQERYTYKCKCEECLAYSEARNVSRRRATTQPVKRHR